MADRDREEESEGFKVVDRRLFTSEGERRPDAEAEPPKAKAPEQKPAPEPQAKPQAKPEAAAPPPRKAPAETSQAEPEHKHAGPASFEQLIMSLATTAMYQLGLVKAHEEDQPRMDVAGARETIDLLHVLQEKTKGNLTQEEQSLLEGSLYELQMMFVELSNPERSR
jgi:outer membrane biosynthesis protein TonB